jgi:hypothetical protein
VSEPLADFALPFELRGVGGRIHVRYGVNDDPRRWGYEVLDLEWYAEDIGVGAASARLARARIPAIGSSYGDVEKPLTCCGKSPE